MTKLSDVTDMCNSMTVITLTLILGSINRKINKSKIKLKKEKINKIKSIILNSDNHYMNHIL